MRRDCEAAGRAPRQRRTALPGQPGAGSIPGLVRFVSYGGQVEPHLAHLEDRISIAAWCVMIVIPFLNKVGVLFWRLMALVARSLRMICSAEET